MTRRNLHAETPSPRVVAKVEPRLKCLGTTSVQPKKKDDNRDITNDPNRHNPVVAGLG